MLDLESDHWSELKHAYGPASDIPALLRDLPSARLKAGYRSEPWFTLWSTLYHQGDVYPASFAAAPHIIAEAARRAPSERAEHLYLVGMIEAGRHRPQAPELTDELLEPYLGCLGSALQLTHEAILTEPEPTWLHALFVAFAAFRGFPELALALSELEAPESATFYEGESVKPSSDDAGGD